MHPERTGNHYRPENIEFATEGIAATVVRSSFLGSMRRIRVKLEDGTPVVVQHSAWRTPVVGERVHVQLDGVAVMVTPVTPRPTTID